MMSALKLSGEYAVAAFSRMARSDCRRLMRPLGRAGAATAGNSLFAITLMVAQPAAHLHRTITIPVRQSCEPAPRLASFSCNISIGCGGSLRRFCRGFGLEIDMIDLI